MTDIFQKQKQFITIFQYTKSFDIVLKLQQIQSIQLLYFNLINNKLYWHQIYYNLQVITIMGAMKSYITWNHPQLQQSNNKHLINTIAKLIAQKSILRTLVNPNSITQNLITNIDRKLNLKEHSSVQLIFKASDYKYKASQFHIKCRQKNNTILLVKTISKDYFGGFSPCSWRDTQVISYEQDSSNLSFLFKIENSQQTSTISYFNLKPECSKFAIMNDNECGPVFGEGHDIIIVDGCDKRQSWNNLGKSYECPYRFGSIKANCTFTEEQRYLIDDYQIWQIKIQ